MCFQIFCPSVLFMQGSVSSTGSLPVQFQAGVGEAAPPMSPAAMQQMASMLWSAHSAAQVHKQLLTTYCFLLLVHIC